MLSFIRRQLSATNLMVVAALIFAMAGGAYAANGGGKHHAHAAGHHGHHAHNANHKGKKGKKGHKGKNNAKRGPRGKQGPPGPEGKAGPAGPPGEKGAAGTNGTDGKNGANGAPGESVKIAVEGECTKFSNASGEGKACNGAEGKAGADGKSVEVSEIAPGCGVAGGITVELEGGAAHEICDGKEGPQGPQGPQGPKGEKGEPWVAGTAPEGAILKGTWSVQYDASSAGETLPIAISTSVPVKSFSPGIAVLVEKGVNIGKEEAAYREAVEGYCPGSAQNPAVSTEPAVTRLCVYVQKASNVTDSYPVKAGEMAGSGGGEVIAEEEFLAAEAPGPAYAYGSWVLVAP